MPRPPRKPLTQPGVEARPLLEAAEELAVAPEPPLPPRQAPPPRCATCPYWRERPDTRLSHLPREDDRQPALGQCLRFPPQGPNPSQLTPLGSVATFPLTVADAVCGEHPAFAAAR